MTRTRGFTLIEVIVTLGILLVLVGIGTVSFTTIKNATTNNTASQNLDRIIFAERAWLARNATWASDPSVLQLGRGLRATNAPSNDPDVVSIAVDDDNTLGLAVMSESGTCYGRTIGDPMTDGTETAVTVDPNTTCSGQGVLGLP